MKKMRKRELNNAGSTLVLVVVSIVFIGLLASLILALSAASFRMKTIDYHSRQNFYEGEEFSSKLYENLGMNSLGILGEAYTATMAQITSGSITGKTELNDYLKKEYYKDMMLYFGLVEKSPTDVNDVLLNSQLSETQRIYKKDDTDADKVGKVQDVENMLKDILKKEVMKADGSVYIANSLIQIPKLTIGGSIVCEPEGGTYVNQTGTVKYPVITINDVHIQYLNTETNYESNYTFDIVVKYPNWDFTYANPVATETDIDSFLDYVFIANDSIHFNKSNSNVNGCVSAGNASATPSNDGKGIIIDYCTVNFNGNSNNWYEENVVITTDNIYINGSATDNSMASFHGGKVWCNSILLDRDATVSDSENGAKLSVSSNSALSLHADTELYVQDDLQLDGRESEVDMNGAYYYGYGVNVTDGGAAQNTSSAIIVNGTGSSVSLAEMKGLYVYGLSYIDMLGNSNYRTGESLSAKSSQEIYLVPKEYMGAGGTNPNRKTNAAEIEAEVEGYLKNGVGSFGQFFGWQWLDQTNPVEVKSYTLNGKTFYFYYLKFDTPLGQSYYAKTVLAGSYADAKSICGDVLTSAQEDIRQAMLERIRENVVDLNNDPSEWILKYTGANAWTVGALVQIQADSNPSSVNMKTEFANLVNTATTAESYRKRYRMMKSLLVDVDGSSAIGYKSIEDYNDVECRDLAVTSVGKRSSSRPAEEQAKYTNTRDIKDLQLMRSVIGNMVNLEKVARYAAENPDGHTQSGYTLKCVVGDYSVGGFTGVLIVDGNVTITGNVKGLVVATGTITITGGGTYTSDPAGVHELLTKEQVSTTAVDSRPWSDVFYFYPTTNVDDDNDRSINELDYSDVLYYDNWRKYEDK